MPDSGSEFDPGEIEEVCVPPTLPKRTIRKSKSETASTAAHDSQAELDPPAPSKRQYKKRATAPARSKRTTRKLKKQATTTAARESEGEPEPAARIKRQYKARVTVRPDPQATIGTPCSSIAHSHQHVLSQSKHTTLLEEFGFQLMSGVDETPTPETLQSCASFVAERFMSVVDAMNHGAMALDESPQGAGKIATDMAKKRKAEGVLSPARHTTRRRMGEIPDSDDDRDGANSEDGEGGEDEED